MIRKWTSEIIEFLKENVKGRYNKELQKMIYEKFGVYFSEESISTKKQKLGLKSELDFTVTRYTPEVVDYILNNYEGKDNIELAKEINEKFNLNLSNDSICNFKSRMYKKGINLRTGINRTRFKKGNVCPNKGRKWSEYMPIESQKRSSVTWFKKGHVPKNAVPVGTEALRVRKGKSSEIKIKICSGNKNENWKPKRQVIWEEHYGKIPEDYLVICADGNNMNYDIDNLLLISKSESIRLNQFHLRFENTELTKTGLNIVKVKNKIKEKERELK